MARCLDCGSHDADPDLMQCFNCHCACYAFSPDGEQGPTEQDYCGSYGHPPYDNEHMLCYCGHVYNIQESIGI